MNYGRPLKLRVASLSYPDLIAKALPLLQDKLTEQRIEVVTGTGAGPPADAG